MGLKKLNRSLTLMTIGLGSADPGFCSLVVSQITANHYSGLGIIVTAVKVVGSEPFRCSTCTQHPLHFLPGYSAAGIFHLIEAIPGNRLFSPFH